MKRIKVETGDGSHSFFVPELNEHYHSRHGAIQESLHVFIGMGLEALPEELTEISILEIGFGTGLNALLTLDWANTHQKKIHYFAVEAFPLGEEEYSVLNYTERIGLQPEFEAMHRCDWDINVAISEFFVLHKLRGKIEDFELPAQVDLVYFDAFAPEKQPELWTEEIFRRISGMMRPGALLTTYCAKGVVRRTMQAAGLLVEKLPGPPGKREMLRASAQIL